MNDSPMGCQNRERASPAGEVSPSAPAMQKALANASAFCSEINPFKICAIPFGGEIAFGK